MSLTSYLIEGLLPEQEKKKVIAVYGGGFKPPTSGHFEVVEQSLKENPEIDEYIIYVGKKERDGITQQESLQIWEIYGKYLPFKVQYLPSTKPPIQSIYNVAKNNPDSDVLWVIGAREGNEEDFNDLATRTKGISKYPNLELRTIVTQGGVSGTSARKSLKISKESFETFLPKVLNDDEKTQIYTLLSNPITESSIDEIKLPSISDIKGKLKKIVDGVKQEGKESKQAFKLLLQSAKSGKELTDLEKQYIKEQLKDILKSIFGAAIFAIPAGSLVLLLLKALNKHQLVTPSSFLNENASYSQSINVMGKIAQLTNHMIDRGMNIEPLPTMEFIDGDSENAKDFFGKTAYYDPNRKHIVLYTEGRHPKDIVRSYAHEMIHHIQNLEGRLGDISTTNTQEDDKLNDIEAEANLKGTMTFRNWTDSLNEENVSGKFYPFKVTDRTYDEEDNSLITTEYKFTTSNNTYRVELYSGEYSPESKTFDLSFGVDRGELNTIDTFQMTGEGNARKILKTILDIVEDFINKEDVEKIVVDGTDEKRKRIYKTLFSSSPSKISDKIELKEAIVGDKIECDNCDWSWNIVDGGDDLFICHKCEHDNTPLNEVKPYKSKHGFDGKLGKDPFGLNQFAREIAEVVISEGRYDTLANKLSSIAFEAFKDIHDRGDKEGEFEFRVDNPDEEHDIPSKDFYFDFVGKVEITDGEYSVDGGANAGFDNEGNEITPLLSVSFKIPKNPNKENPPTWENISFDIKDVVRHELEHLTQDGDNERPGKYMEDDQLIRDLIDADMLPKAQYFKLEKEVDAMLQGLYFKAKKSKRPFKDVVNDYLNIFLNQKTITPEEKENILDIWRSRRGALSLPLI